MNPEIEKQIRSISEHMIAFGGKIDAQSKKLNENNVRYLKELRLLEGSLVTFPMNEAVHVTSVKALANIQPLLCSIIDANDAEVARSCATLIVS